MEDGPVCDSCPPIATYHGHQSYHTYSLTVTDTPQCLLHEGVSKTYIRQNKMSKILVTLVNVCSWETWKITCSTYVQNEWFSCLFSSVSPADHVFVKLHYLWQCILPSVTLWKLQYSRLFSPQYVQKNYFNLFPLWGKINAICCVYLMKHLSISIMNESILNTCYTIHLLWFKNGWQCDYVFLR